MLVIDTCIITLTTGNILQQIFSIRRVLGCVQWVAPYSTVWRLWIHTETSGSGQSRWSTCGERWWSICGDRSPPGQLTHLCFHQCFCYYSIGKNNLVWCQFFHFCSITFSHNQKFIISFLQMWCCYRNTVSCWDRDRGFLHPLARRPSKSRTYLNREKRIFLQMFFIDYSFYAYVLMSWFTWLTLWQQNFFFNFSTFCI